MPAHDPRHGAIFDLSARTKLRVTGADRLRFLNGQITNNISKATASSAVAACVLNTKGRVNAHIFASATDDSFLIDTSIDLREMLKARLERYIIADQVEIEDLTDRFALFHSLTSNIPQVSDHCRIVSVNRFSRAGFDLSVAAERHDELFDVLSKELPVCDDVCAEVFRIEEGLPRWGRELTEEIMPAEANLEQSCVDYEKGCYIGQEVVSRMKMSGQRNKKLCGLAAGDAKLTAGMRLFLAGTSAPNKEVGWITSAAYSNRFGQEIALGYVKRGFNETATVLNALTENAHEQSAVQVEIVDLPFALPARQID